MGLVDRTVYRTQDPDCIKVFTDWQDGVEAWQKALKRALRKLGVAKHNAMTSGAYGNWVGITVNPRNSDEPPPGWRLDKKSWMFVPFKKTAEGKEVAKVMADTQPPQTPDRNMPGMLGHHFGIKGGNLVMMHPAFEIRDGYLYAIWGYGKIPEKSQDGKKALIDRKLWEKVKLSEWVAMLEEAGVEV